MKIIKKKKICFKNFFKINKNIKISCFSLISKIKSKVLKKTNNKSIF